MIRSRSREIAGSGRTERWVGTSRSAASRPCGRGWPWSGPVRPAVGRAPLVEGIGLEAAGVTFDPKAGVQTDGHRRTSVPHIYAAGDVAGYWQLAHTGFIRPIGEPGLPLGDQWAECLPLRFERTPCEEYHRTRLLGEDNAAVLADWLGLPPDEVAAQEAKGVLC